MLEILSQSFEILLLCDLDHMNLGLIQRMKSNKMGSAWKKRGEEEGEEVG